MPIEGNIKKYFPIEENRMKIEGNRRKYLPIEENRKPIHSWTSIKENRQ